MGNKILIALTALFLAGCGKVLDYQGKRVGETTREAAAEAGRNYQDAWRRLSKAGISGAYPLAKGLAGTIHTAATGLNDAVESVMGGATTGLENLGFDVPILKHVGRGINHARKCAFDDLPGGETWHNSFSLRDPTHLLSADYEAATRVYGELGFASGVEATIKTAFRLGTMFYGGSSLLHNKKSGGKAIEEEPGPTPDDPF